MDRRGRLQTHSTPDRGRPAPPLRRRMGVPQETVVPRHLELLRNPRTEQSFRARTAPSPPIFSRPTSPSFWLSPVIYPQCPKVNRSVRSILLYFSRA